MRPFRCGLASCRLLSNCYNLSSKQSRNLRAQFHQNICRFCPNDEWRLPKHLNCSNNDCPVVEAILDYAKDNLVMFNIFIKDPYAKRFMKDEKITKTAYIANSGGLLGICLLLTFLTDNFVFAFFILIGYSLLLGLVL